LGPGNPLLERQHLDHGQLYFIFLREVVPGEETDLADGRLVGSLDLLHVNEGEVLEGSQAFFENFQVLIFLDELQDIQVFHELIDFISYV
jgi:hypothetical protein